MKCITLDIKESWTGRQFIKISPHFDLDITPYQHVDISDKIRIPLTRELKNPAYGAIGPDDDLLKARPCRNAVGDLLLEALDYRDRENIVSPGVLLLVRHSDSCGKLLRCRTSEGSISRRLILAEGCKDYHLRQLFELEQPLYFHIELNKSFGRGIKTVFFELRDDKLRCDDFPFIDRTVVSPKEEVELLKESISEASMNESAQPLIPQVLISRKIKFVSDNK